MVFYFHGRHEMYISLGGMLYSQQDLSSTSTLCITGSGLQHGFSSRTIFVHPQDVSATGVDPQQFSFANALPKKLNAKKLKIILFILFLFFVSFYYIVTICS